MSDESPWDMQQGPTQRVGDDELATRLAALRSMKGKKKKKPSQRRDKLFGPQAFQDLIGKTIEGYRFEAKVGQGGMGQVFRAKRESDGLTVAIKILPGQCSSDPALNEQLRQESRIVRELDHPMVVRTLAEFELEGSYCIVMEYLPDSVRTRLNQGPLPLADALAIVKAVGRALRDIAKRGVIHRDVKPDNLLLAADGSPRIADFGLATSEQEVEFTESGELVGTPAYIAPEQCRDGRHADHRSDLYALGCSLFEMLCGEKPFSGPSTVNYIEQHIRQPPPLAKLAALEIPQPVIECVARLMAKAPEDRYQSGVELATDLESHGRRGERRATGRSTTPATRLPAPAESEVSAAGPPESARTFLHGLTVAVVVAGVLGVVLLLQAC